MNKANLVEELIKKTGLDEEKCKAVTEHLEGALASQEGGNVVESLMKNLNLEGGEADKIAEVAKGVLSSDVKDKLFGALKKD